MKKQTNVLCVLFLFAGVALGDGSIRFVSDAIDNKMLRKLLTSVRKNKSRNGT